MLTKEEREWCAKQKSYAVDLLFPELKAVEAERDKLQAEVWGLQEYASQTEGERNQFLRERDAAREALAAREGR